MTGKFLLRKDKKSNDYGEYCVYLQYSTQKVSVKKSMGIWVKPDHWLGDDGRSKKYILAGKLGNPKGDMLNQKLYNQKKKYDSMIEDMMNENNCVLSVQTLRDILNGTFQQKKEKKEGKVSFVEYVLKVNEEEYNRGKVSYSVWHNVQNQMDNFKKYLQENRIDTNEDTTLYCLDISVDVIEGYIKWRKKKGNCGETINKSLTPIFKAVRKIISLGWIDRSTGEEITNLYVPTSGRSVGEGKGTDKHYLTEGQIKELIRIAGNCRFRRTKEFVDMFIFSIHTGGLRFSDICTLKWSEIDFENRIITHLQVKNHTRKPTFLTLPITDEGLRILRDWEGRNDEFVFDMLCEDFDLTNEPGLKETLNSLNRTVNQSLRCLGEKMDLPFRLHFHCSRHSFATLSLNREVDLNVISNLMGHSSSWVTGKVYSKYLPQTLSKEVNEKLNFKF